LQPLAGRKRQSRERAIRKCATAATTNDFSAKPVQNSAQPTFGRGPPAIGRVIGARNSLVRIRVLRAKRASAASVSERSASRGDRSLTVAAQIVRSPLLRRQGEFLERAAAEPRGTSAPGEKRGLPRMPPERAARQARKIGRPPGRSADYRAATCSKRSIFHTSNVRLPAVKAIRRPSGWMHTSRNARISTPTRRGSPPPASTLHNSVV